MTLIEILDCALSADRVLKTLKLLELRNGRFIYLFDTFIRFFTNCLLVISQQKSPKLLPLEEVFAIVLRFWHC